MNAAAPTIAPGISQYHSSQRRGMISPRPRNARKNTAVIPTTLTAPSRNPLSRTALAPVVSAIRKMKPTMRRSTFVALPSTLRSSICHASR